MSERRAVRVCGLGAVPPEDATLEVLQALRSCREVYTDLADAGALAWLGTLCPLKKTSRAADVLGASRGSGAVGLAVWGHPLINSPLALEVVAGARREKIPCEIFAGISPLGAWLAREAAFLGGEEGVKGAQTCALETALERPALLDCPVPLIVYAEKGGAWGRLSQELSRLSRKEFKLGVYALPGFQKKTVTPAELSAAAPSGALVLIPPRGSSA